MIQPIPADDHRDASEITNARDQARPSVADNRSMYQRPPADVVEILSILSKSPHDFRCTLTGAGRGLHLGDSIDDLLKHEVELLVSLFRQLAVADHVVDLSLDASRQRVILLRCEHFLMDRR